MKTSEAFFHYFEGQEGVIEIRKDVRIAGKFLVRYEHDEGKVFGIEVNTGLDCPQIWERVDIYNRELYTICEQHLIDIQQEV